MRQWLEVISIAAVNFALASCSSTNFGSSTGKATVAPASSASTTVAAQTPATTADASGNNSNSAGSTAADANSAGTTAATPKTPIVPPAPAAAYVNTDTQLYTFATSTASGTPAPVLVGTFAMSGTSTQYAADASQILDIAVDGAGKMYAITQTELYTVNPLTAELTHFMSHTIPDSVGLACLSTGTIIVGGDTLYSINSTTMAVTQLVAPGKYATSGDVIALPDGKLYWTATTLTNLEGLTFGTTPTDILISVDPKTGTSTVVGDTGAAGIFGLAYANSVLYGFTADGKTIAIDPTTGKMTKTLATNALIEWSGATTNPVKWP